MTARSIEDRVARAAEAALADKRFVTPVDVLMSVGWLQPGLVDRWRQGRVEYLEAAAQVDSEKLSEAMAALVRWSEQRGLQPSETEYAARTRDRRRLRFTASGDAAIERAYSTHWVSTELSERKRERLRERQSRPPDLVVISPIRDWACAECGGSGGLLMMEEGGPLCLDCVDMGHLVFLPSGDAALTRRAKRASRLSAVVVRFSRARRRYERQGILVEESALDAAEAECLEDEEVRRRRRLRDETRRVDEDRALPGRARARNRAAVPGLSRGPGGGDRPARRDAGKRPGGEDPGRAGAGPGGHHACGGRLGAPRGHALRRAADVRGGQGRGKGPRPTRRRPSPGQLAPLTRPVRGAIPAPRPR
jgi:hypothetical protein